MADAVHRAEHRRIVGPLDRLADPAEPERAQRALLPRVGAVGRLDLGDLDVGHHAGVSSGASAGAPLLVTRDSSLSRKPSTLRTGSPRSSATSCGERSICSAVTVAFTRLIGFWLPSDFESTSWMPASSSTARTPPPAITPVPSEAGFRKTFAAPCTPVTSWVIVLPCIGTLKRLRRAFSTPFWIATGTSFALPYPTPTCERSSPTTTRAVHEKPRPPLTTFATRLISTTRSCSSPYWLSRSRPRLRCSRAIRTRDLLRARPLQELRRVRGTGNRRDRTRSSRCRPAWRASQSPRRWPSPAPSRQAT